ncbi:MAG: GNAT family N-acetyltransferase [Desulfobacteraceae bacterium]|nr:MAG: GNAT family N-acetyltransferase [Desulfobacteraceae bacterium]
MIHDLIIRSAQASDAEQIARIYVDTWRATYANILPRSYLEQMRYDQTILSMQRALLDPRIECLMAEERNQAAGYITGGLERNQDPIYQAEIFELYLLPAFQRKGTGTRLLAALAQRLHQHRLYSMKVWVLSANPYRRFYERTGGIFLSSKFILFAGRRLKADAFGWIDITLAEEVWG